MLVVENGALNSTHLHLQKATGVPLLAYWVFQYAFADTCSTVTSGAMIGRCDFIGDLLYSVGVTGFIYPIIGHWAWGPDGWLAVMAPISFHDFAGSTVVHTIGAAISLAGAIVLGPRLGRVFKRDGGAPMKPHDLIIGATGGLILWFGWYGFLRIDDPIGAVPVHMMAGIWGTLSLGLFAAGKYGSPTPMGADTSTVVTGLFYGGGFGVLISQMIGSFSITIATFVAAMALMYGVQIAFRLRIPTEGEIEGLDLHKHGFPAYPEYVVTGDDGCPKTIDDVPIGRRTFAKPSKKRAA